MPVAVRLCAAEGLGFTSPVGVFAVSVDKAQGGGASAAGHDDGYGGLMERSVMMALAEARRHGSAFR